MVVLAVWLLIAIVLGVGSAGAGKPFRDVFTIPGTDSQAAVDVLAKRFPTENLPTATVVFRDKSGARVRRATVAAARDRGREAARRSQSVGTPRVSSNGHDRRCSRVTYGVPLADLSLDTVDRLEGATACRARRRASRWRTAARSVDFVQQKTAPQNHADEIGLLAAVIILLFVFGTVVAATPAVERRADRRDDRHRSSSRSSPRQSPSAPSRRSSAR